jgi:putative NADPH-quinone reductase
LIDVISGAPPVAEDRRMSRRILIIQAHPDPAQRHFCHALADAYVAAARAARHDVRTVDVGAIDFPLLRSKTDWEDGSVPPSLAPAQTDIRWAEHVVFFFPLWLGGMPALLKGFLEQVARPGFALSKARDGGLPKKLLAGRSARLVVTMGMPALIYRWFFRAHSLKALERNILGFVGIGPVRETLVGSVEALSPAERQTCLRKLAALGTAAR